MLAQMQLQFEQRFATLAAARKPLGNPVYALEHGLDLDAIVELGRAASDHLRKVGLFDKHWLVWTVLATEAGYRYTGDEYWPAVEIVPDEWRNNNHRAWLRRRFQRFKDKYGGPLPVGRWADHFSIISWPIANAILPRYLQSHFARHLYALRFVLSDVANRDFQKLGQVLCDAYDGSSSRFEDFLQQVDLTTQIVMALRDEDVGDTAPRIDPTLLRRIVADLEERRDSREYLRAARKVISTRRATATAGLVGAGPNRTAAGKSEPIVSGPRLAVRRLGAESVMVGLIYPDIAAALSRAALSHAALSTSRIKMAGVDTRFEPAIGLVTLSGQDRQLEVMPPAGIPAIALETTDHAVRSLLEPLLLIPEQINWVLRRQSDGLYREVAGGHIRTGQSYVILTRSAWSDAAVEAADLQRCSAQTTGLCAYALDVGDRLPEVQRAALAALGIGAVIGTRIEPVGLAPSFPEPARSANWLTSETVTLRIFADFDVGGFLIRLDDEHPKAFAAKDGELTIGLDPLNLGSHRLTVQALNHSHDVQSAVGETAAFEFCVSAPGPWQDDMRGKAGFRMIVEPSGSTLEQLLAGLAQLTILGPAGRTVQWSLETFDAAGHLTTASDAIVTRVGAATSSIASVLDRLRQTQSEAIDVAHRVDIVAGLGELGRQAIAFPRQVDPLRWHFDPAHQSARLIDETAHEVAITVRSYSLSAPLKKQVIDYSAAINGTAVEPPGALLIADHQSRRYAIFASAPAAVRLQSLSELGLSQTLDLSKPGQEAMLILLSALRRWHQARSVGVQAIVRKFITLEKIRAEIAARACGHDFVAALALRELKPLARAQTMVGGSPGFGFRMRTFPLPECAEAGQQAFADIARHYDIERDPSRCADAYKLAFEPLSLRLGPGHTARDRLLVLLANRPLVRGAHLAYAATRLPAEPRAEAG